MDEQIKKLQCIQRNITWLWKRRDPVTSNNMNEPRGHHVKWNKSIVYFYNNYHFSILQLYLLICCLWEAGRWIWGPSIWCISPRECQVPSVPKLQKIKNGWFHLHMLFKNTKYVDIENRTVVTSGGEVEDIGRCSSEGTKGQLY